MEIWEYKIIQACDVSDEIKTKELNVLGNDGWEITATVSPYCRDARIYLRRSLGTVSYTHGYREVI